MEMTVREARAGFAAALSAAERGEQVTITRNGKPVAQIGPLADAKPKQPFDWAELDRLQEELGILTPTPEQSEHSERLLNDAVVSRAVLGLDDDWEPYRQ